MNTDLAKALTAISSTIKSIHTNVLNFKKNTLKIKINATEPKDQLEAEKILEQLNN